MRVVTTIEGIDTLREAFKTAPKKTRALLGDAFKAAADATAADARNNVHVKRGDLRDAIGFDGRGVSWRAGVRVYSVEARGGASSHRYPSVYGHFEEYGTNDTPAHPFMRPAAEAERGRLPGRLRDVAAKLESAMARGTLGGTVGSRARDSRGRFI